MAWGWGISLKLVSMCSGVRDFLSFSLAPSLGKGPANNCLGDSPCLPVIYSPAGCLPVKFAGWPKNSCVNGFGGVIKTCYTRARGKEEECFIFGWRMFNFYWKNGPFQGSLKQLGLSVVSSIAPIAKGDS